MHRAPAAALIVACVTLLHAAAARVPGRANTLDMDRSVKPGDDFYSYANGGWMKTVQIPAGHAGYDTRALLTERTGQRVRDLIAEAATGASIRGGTAQQVGDYYASVTDQATIEARGLAPLAKDMTAIAAIADRTELSAYLGSTLNSEVDGLTSNRDHLFGAWVNQGFDEARRCVVHLLQGGLGLSDREAYIEPSIERSAMRAKYRAHIAAIFRLAHFQGPDARAVRVLALESRIAAAHAPEADAADVFKQNNRWTRADFEHKAPGMDWRAYFTAAGVDAQANFIVWQPSAVAGVAALITSADVDVWRDYLRFHLIEHYATVLPTAIAAEDFAFYGKTLSGLEEMPDRETIAIAATNAALGQAVGVLYTSRFFPPAAKAKAQAMVADLIAAFDARIGKLAWMSPATKHKASAKLAALRIGVGYPDVWIDYSSFVVVRGDAFGNMMRAEAFNRSRNLAKLRQPADPDEWRIDPQMVAAVILFSPNTETFAAGVLQPPYFDSEGDAASNYGSAGVGIAHEITHSFDELGNVYDEQGRLRRWWTAADVSNYHAATASLAAQLDRYCPLRDLCVNGAQVLNESVADLAGLQVAHDAYLRSLRGSTDAVIDGLSGEQRFFLAFAQRWRRTQTEIALRHQIATDNHLPGAYRGDAVRNVDAWYSAYTITPAERLYLNPADRVSIW